MKKRMPLLILTLALIFMANPAQTKKWQAKPAPAKKPSPTIVPKKAASQPKKQAPVIRERTAPTCAEETEMVVEDQVTKFCHENITVKDPYVAASDQKVFVNVNELHVGLPDDGTPQQITDKKVGILYIHLDRVIDARIHKVNLTISSTWLLPKRCSENWKCKTPTRMVYQRANCKWDDQDAISCPYGCDLTICKTQRDTKGPCIETIRFGSLSETNICGKQVAFIRLQQLDTGDGADVEVDHSRELLTVGEGKKVGNIYVYLDDYFRNDYINFNDNDARNHASLTISSIDLYNPTDSNPPYQMSLRQPCRKMVTLELGGSPLEVCGETISAEKRQSYNELDYTWVHYGRDKAVVMRPGDSIYDLPPEN